MANRPCASCGKHIPTTQSIISVGTRNFHGERGPCIRAAGAWADHTGYRLVKNSASTKKREPANKGKTNTDPRCSCCGSRIKKLFVAGDDGKVWNSIEINGYHFCPGKGRCQRAAEAYEEKQVWLGGDQLDLDGGSTDMRSLT